MEISKSKTYKNNNKKSKRSKINKTSQVTRGTNVLRQMLDVPEISQSLNIEESINEALEQIMITSINNNKLHSAIVCV